MDTPLSENESTPLLEDAIERGQYDTEPRKATEEAHLHPTQKWAKVKYYFPFLEWLPNYSLSLLSGDVLAGLTVACMLIPQSVSYATSLARLSPLAGLFAAAIPGAVYALLGSSRQLNVAPEATLSLLVGQAVQAALHGDPHDHPADTAKVAIAVTTVITLQVGVFSFLLGFLRLGFIDVVLSRALLRGFITAIALVIMIEQLIPMFGLTSLEHQINPHSTLDKFLFLIEYVWTHEHRPTTLVSFGALGALVGLRTLKKPFQRFWFIYRLPEVLIVVIAFTVLCDIFDWDLHGVEILGSVPIKTGASFFAFPLRHYNVKYVKDTTSTAILVAIVGFLDSIVAAKQNADRFGYIISPNRELVALGAGNIVASFVPGTLPAAGSITRSKINADVGGRSQMASLVCSVVVLITTFTLLPALYYLPKGVLAAVICLVVFSLLAEAPEDVHFYWTMQGWTEMMLMSLTFFCTLIWNVEVGVVVSVLISLLLVVRRSSTPRMSILGRIPGTDRWKSVNENSEAEEDVPGALIVRIRDSLDFANTARLKERMRRLELYGAHPSHPSDAPRRPRPDVIVFHMADVETCDASAAQIFFELVSNYKSQHVAICIAHLRPGPRVTFEKAGIVKLLGEDLFFEDVATAMARVEMVEMQVGLE